MSGEEHEPPKKKDLTSLLELSELELAKNPADVASDVPGLEQNSQIAVTDADFGSLDEVHLNFEDAPTTPSDNESLELDPIPQTETANRTATATETEPAPALVLESTPPLNAPPAGFHQASISDTPAQAKHDLEDIKEFGEKLAIGSAHMEAAPAFSVLLTNKSGKFSEKEISEIRDVLTADDYGIRFEEIEIQLGAGKLLVPQISEFAAIMLAQKLRDVVDDIQLDLANEIYQSSAAEMVTPNEAYRVDSERFDQHREEIHDMDAEPKSERDLFSTTLPEISHFEITRILSAVTVSAVLEAAVAESPTSPDFEKATEQLTRDLVAKAFKLGAHGVIGVAFNLRPIEASRDAAGDRRHAYRLLGSGTAVRGHKR